MAVTGFWDKIKVMLRKNVFLNAFMVYSIRGLSGVGTLMAILLIGIYYSSEELAEYSLFMLFFNLITVFFLWGDAVNIVDRYNNESGDKKVVAPLGYKILDGAIVMVLFYFVLDYFEHWNVGLLGGIPIGLAALLSALLVVKNKVVAASLCFEFSRAMVPFIIMALAVLIGSVKFEFLVAISYSSFFVGIPLILAYAKKNKLWDVDFSIRFKKWCESKRAALPIVVPQIIIILVFQADRLFIDYLGSADELASYFSAQTLYTVVLVAVHSTFNLVIPETSKVAVEGQGSLRNASRIMLIVQLGASLLFIPVAYIYLGLIGVDKVMAMEAMLLLMAGGIISSCFGIGLPVMQFCKRKDAYLKIVLAGVFFQFAVIGVGYSAFGLYAVALGFVAYNLFTSILAACYWRRKSVTISPF